MSLSEDIKLYCRACLQILILAYSRTAGLHSYVSVSCRWAQEEGHNHLVKGSASSQTSSGSEDCEIFPVPTVDEPTKENIVAKSTEKAPEIVID